MNCHIENKPVISLKGNMDIKELTKKEILVLDEISDNIRKGISVSLPEALLAIDYQEELKSRRKKKSNDSKVVDIEDFKKKKKRKVFDVIAFAKKKLIESNPNFIKYFDEK